MHVGRHALAAILVSVLMISAGCGSFGSTTATEPTATPAVTDTEPTAATDGTATDGTETDAATTDGGVGTVTATDEPEDLALNYRIVEITTINQTARNVTVRLTNDGNETATGVAAETVIYAGNTTADDQQIWTGSREVGSVAAGGSVQFSQTVALSLNEALQVEGADGWITVVTTIRTDEGSVTVTQRRNVN